MKKILIVGGTGGLGSKVSYILSKRYEVDSIGSKNLDITDYKLCDEFFKNNEYDIVINFSGLNYDSFVHRLNLSDHEKIKSMVDVNILGNINLTSSALKMMRKRNFGRIILISSVLSEKTVLGTGIYSSCKAFIDKLVKNISLENIKFGITSNSLQLGYFDGGMTYKIPGKNVESIVNSIGLNRLGKIEEIVQSIEFLINNEYVTGINLKIDGGL